MSLISNDTFEENIKGKGVSKTLQNSFCSSAMKYSILQNEIYLPHHCIFPRR